MFRPTEPGGLRGWIRALRALPGLVWLLLAGCRSHDLRQLDPAHPEVVFETIRSQMKRGEFSHLTPEAKQAFAAWQARPAEEWHWKFKMLYAELLLLDGETGEASKLIAAAPPARFANLAARRHMLEGYVSYRRGLAREAEAILTQAADAAHAASDFELEADAQLTMASFASAERSLEMQSLIERIIAVANAHGLKFQLAGAYLDYGMLRVHQSRYAEAIGLFDQAAHAAEQADAPLLHSIALGDVATCYSSLGDFDRSMAMRRRSIGVQTRAGLKTALRDSYLELGATQSLQGDAEDAVKSLRQAFSLVNADDSPEPYSDIACTLAAELESTGSLDEAERLNFRARSVSKGAYPEIQAAEMLNEAAIAEHRGHHNVAIEQYLRAVALSKRYPSSLWAAHAGAGLVYAGMGKVTEARAHFEAAIGTVQANRAEQLQSRYQITFLSRLIRLYQDYVELLVHTGDEDHALEVADSSHAAVLDDDSFNKGVPQDHFVPRLRRLARTSGTVFLSYWLAPKQSYVWVLSANGLKTIPLGNADQIAQQVKSYRYLVEQEKLDPIASSSQLPSRLFEELLGSALSSIPKGTSVVIVPDGVLNNLNFESLVVDGPRPHYWLEDASIAVAPSLRMLADAPAHSGPDAKSLLLIGDPNAATAEFPKLANAGTEMERVATHFPAATTIIRRGQDAVPDAYRESQPGRFQTIHLAAHAEANQQSPLDSAIILSKQKDGFRLYAREIMEIPIRAELVTISACRGAGTRTFSGEGAVGFAWAFFKAGARNVIAGLWDVNDLSTSDLMDAFYAQVKKGRSYQAALREAKISMSGTQFRKPYYWAPFQLYTRSMSSPGR